MKPIKLLIVIGVGLLMLACGPSQLFAPTSTPTPIPTPTVPPTPTPSPIEAVDLAAVIEQAGDMPMNCKAGDTSDMPPWTAEYLAKFPETDQSIYQSILCSGDDVGGAAIFLYEDQADVARAYSEIKNESDLDDLGEQASAEASCGIVVKPGVSAGMSCWAHYSFTRCNAVVRISLSGIKDAKSGAQFAYTYAKQLDEALTPLVCLDY